MNSDGTGQTRLTNVFAGNWTRGKPDSYRVERGSTAVLGTQESIPNEGLITNFQPGHGFTYTAGGGSSVDDTSFHAIGDQSLQITTDGHATQSVVTKNGISPTINISGEIIKLVVAVDNTLNLTSDGQILVAFSSDGFASSYVAFSATGTVNSAGPGGAWVTCSFSLSDTYVSGAPNLSAIDAIRIYVRDIGMGALHAWIQSISYYPPKLDHGIVTFTFDDDWVTQYTYGFAKLRSYGYPATDYVTRGLENDPAYLSLAQMHDLQDNYGWDISAHGHVSLATLTQAQCQVELLAMQDFLSTNGLNGGEHLAYTGGNYNTNIVLPLVQQYFATARQATSGQHEVFPPADYYGLKVVTLTEPSNNPSAISTQVTKAINNKDWLILVFHNLVTTAPKYSTECLVDDFNAIVDDVHSQGIQVKTISQVLAELTSTPSVTTNPATSISSTTATLSGNLSAMGSATIANVSFEYGLTTSYGSTAPAIPASLTMPGTFSANLAGLSAGTTYHYRARASGGTDGISYGSDRSFATLGGPTTPPSVTTNPATSISTTTATLSGNLSAMGSATIANVSFEYGLTTSYGNTATGSPATRTVPGIFSAALAGLNVGTTYHYRAKADGGSAGFAYGSDQSFTTSTPGGSSILFENYHATQNSSGVGLHAAQTFTPQTTHTITSAKVRLFNTGATGSVSVSIRAVDAAGIPTGANFGDLNIGGQLRHPWCLDRRAV